MAEREAKRKVLSGLIGSCELLYEAEEVEGCRWLDESGTEKLAE